MFFCVFDLVACQGFHFTLWCSNRLFENENKTQNPTFLELPHQYMPVFRDVAFISVFCKGRWRGTAMPWFQRNYISGRFVPWLLIQHWVMSAALYLDLLFKSLLWQSLMLTFQVLLHWINMVGLAEGICSSKLDLSVLPSCDRCPDTAWHESSDFCWNAWNSAAMRY